MATVPQADIQVGHWWAPCCVHDLEQITTEDEAIDARDFIPFAGAWPTLRDALADLLQLWKYSGEPEWLADDVAYARERFPSGFDD